MKMKSVRRILFGDVPPIRTLGFITALDSDDTNIEIARANRDWNKKLEEYLCIRNLSPVLVKSRLFENTYLVPNVHRGELVTLGRHFQQQAVLWGQKENDEFQFECRDTASGLAQSVRSIGEFPDKLRKAEAFRIPFFDDPSAELVFDGRVKELTYYSDRLPDNPVVHELVADIQHHTEALFDKEYGEYRAKSTGIIGGLRGNACAG